ncbi:helix-turn-helix transcriptional regulator [Streptomyces sp. PRB2-1]|uniref:Helix-turn-helix transcriptional regulator n=1 Tax=Actinacidiphila epipremni TaxID=2053013 RepID=A0ABX0ZKL4_9ACTN|nr:helix-turn-helix transcriptional regulator [Actinacidiphila epipremni]
MAGAAVEVEAFAAGGLESAEVPHPGGGAAGAGDGVRAEALLLRAEVAWSADEPLAVAAQTAEQALRCAPAGSAQAGRIHAYLSLFHDTPELAQRHAEAACALLGGASPQDAELLSGSLLQLFFHEVRGGRPPRRELLDRALALEDGRPSWLGGTIPAIWWRSIDEHDKARARLHAMLERAVAAGDEPGQHELLAHLGETELVAGRYDDAARALAGARELGEQLGTGLVGETWLLGLLDAHRGELAAARAVAEAGLRRAEAVGDPWARRIHLALSAFTALSEGRTDDAAADYRALAAEADAAGLAEPLSQRFEPDWIEACAAAGDLATARRVLRRLAERHERLPRPWTTLGLARSRALLAAASGEDTAAPADALEEARARVPAHVVPLDRARCLLVAGVVHRRARRRRAARTALEQAAAEFAAIGAAAFERRARAELARTGGRAPASEALTATEERVAALAAAGRTNRAIADALFISPKTVEANLARVYRKLGISRRAELGAALSRRAGT